MRVVADRDTCEGLGMCEAMSELFEVGDDGSVVVAFSSVPDDASEQIRTLAAASLDSLRIN